MAILGGGSFFLIILPTPSSPNRGGIDEGIDAPQAPVFDRPRQEAAVDPLGLPTDAPREASLLAKPRTHDVMLPRTGEETDHATTRRAPRVLETGHVAIVGRVVGTESSLQRLVFAVEDRKIGVPPSLAVRDVEGLADQAPGFHWQRGIERSSVEDSDEFRLDLSLPRDPHEWEFRVIALLRDPSSVSDVVMWRSLPRTLLRSGVWDLGEIVFDREVLVKASIISGQPAENAIRWVLFTRNSDPSAATLTDPLDLSLDSWMPFQLSTFGDGTELLTSFAPCEAYGKTAILVAHIGASWTLQGPMVLSNTNDYGELCLLEYGRIAGRVVDSDGRTPDWFSVTIEFLGSKAEAGVMRRIAPGWERPIRDDEGGFMTCQLPPGFYRLTPVFSLNRMGYPLEVCLRAGDHLHVELIGKGH